MKKKFYFLLFAFMQVYYFSICQVNLQRTTVISVPNGKLEWVLSSPNGKVVVVAVKKMESVSVYRDSQLIGTYDHAVAPMFSVDSKSFCFVGIHGTTATIILNGQAVDGPPIPGPVDSNIGLFGFGMAQAMAISTDGTKLAYRIAQAAPQQTHPNIFAAGSFSMVLDGAQQAAHMEVGRPVFHPVTSELVYSVKDKGPLDGKNAYILINNVAQTKYYDVTDPFYSADGSLLLYTARTGFNEWVLVANGNEVAIKSPMIGYVSCTADGKHHAFISGFSPQAAVVDGAVGALCGSVSPVIFSPDGTSHGYVAKKSQASLGSFTNVLMINGQEITTSSSGTMNGPFFDKQNRYTYITQDGVKGYLVTPLGVWGPYSAVYPPFFSDDGKHIIYGAMDGISQTFKIFLNSKEIDEPVGLTMPVFSGSTVSYFSVKQTETLDVSKLTITLN